MTLRGGKCHALARKFVITWLQFEFVYKSPWPERQCLSPRRFYELPSLGALALTVSSLHPQEFSVVWCQEGHLVINRNKVHFSNSKSTVKQRNYY